MRDWGPVDDEGAGDIIEGSTGEDYLGGDAWPFPSGNDFLGGPMSAGIPLPDLTVNGGPAASKSSADQWSSSNTDGVFSYNAPFQFGATGPSGDWAKLATYAIAVALILGVLKLWPRRK